MSEKRSVTLSSRYSPSELKRIRLRCELSGTKPAELQRYAVLRLLEDVSPETYFLAGEIERLRALFTEYFADLHNKTPLTVKRANDLASIVDQRLTEYLNARLQKRLFKKGEDHAD